MLSCKWHFLFFNANIQGFNMRKNRREIFLAVKLDKACMVSRTFSMEINCLAISTLMLLLMKNGERCFTDESDMLDRKMKMLHKQGNDIFEILNHLPPRYICNVMFAGYESKCVY